MEPSGPSDSALVSGLYNGMAESRVVVVANSVYTQPPLAGVNAL